MLVDRSAIGDLENRTVRRQQDTGDACSVEQAVFDYQNWVDHALGDQILSHIFFTQLCLAPPSEVNPKVRVSR